MVSTSCHYGLREPELGMTRADADDARRDLCSPVVNLQVSSVGDLLQLVQQDIEPVAHGVGPGGDYHVSSGQVRPLDPGRLSATRCPATARSTLSSCTCTERTRTARPRGSTTSSSPLPIEPDQSVPVATVPMPRRVNTRSTNRRVGRELRRRSCESAAAARLREARPGRRPSWRSRRRRRRRARARGPRRRQARACRQRPRQPS